MWDQGHGVTRDVEDRVVEGPKGHSEDDVAAVLGVALQRVVAFGRFSGAHAKFFKIWVWKLIGLWVSGSFQISGS